MLFLSGVSPLNKSSSTRLCPRVEAKGAKENNDSNVSEEHKEYLVDYSTPLTTGLHFHVTNTTSRRPHTLCQQRSAALSSVGAQSDKTFISAANRREPAAVWGYLLTSSSIYALGPTWSTNSITHPQSAVLKKKSLNSKRFKVEDAHLYSRVRSTAWCGWTKHPRSRSWTRKTGSSGWTEGSCQRCGMALSSVSFKAALA